MRVCLVYDCLYPYTVGGAERWYRNLGERLAREGHDVTLVTMRQWDSDHEPDVPGVRVVPAGPRMSLYTRGGRRRILPPIVFGAAVLGHLLARGRYDVVHTASFPYFSLLAAAAVRPLRRYRLIVDWHELWTRGYWREYLGALGGRLGWAVQWLCLKVPQRAFCFSHLHGDRLVAEGVNGPVTVLKGEYDGPLGRPDPAPAAPVIVAAGRHIPEKHLPALVPAMAVLHEQVPELRCQVFGDGPERPALLRAIAEAGLEDTIEAPGFVSGERVQSAMKAALCHVLPSRREGYGLVVIEAAAVGTPTVVVRHEDNAAVELVAEGVNGAIADSERAEDVAAAVLRIRERGHALRESTADWFERNGPELSLARSLDVVARSYAGEREPASTRS